MNTGDNSSPQERALDVDRVEWLAASPRAVLVRLRGRQRAPLSPGAVATLLVDDGERRHAFATQTGLSVDAGEGTWSATFSVPIELRPQLETGLVLDLDGFEMSLPAAVAGADFAAEAPAQIVDRAVLAERRARRAELNEQALTARANEAEATVRTLQGQLGHLEQRMAETAREREQLMALLAERDTEARRLKQREYAEQQQRFGAEEHARNLERERAEETRLLRERLQEADSEVQRLAEEQEGLQRELAEAQQSAAAEESRLRRARQQLELREAQIAQRERALTTAEHERETEREGSAVELAQQLERGGELQQQLQAELSALQGELESVRASAERQRERNVEADGLLNGLADTLTSLRSELETLERDKGEAELEAERLRGELGELQQTLREARAQPVRDDAELTRLRTLLEDRDRALASAEQTIISLREAATELRSQLQLERDEHAASAAELRAQIEQERAASQERVAAAEASLREELTKQLEPQVVRVNAAEEALTRLTGELQSASEKLVDRERALELAHAAELAARAEVERVAEREANLDRMVRELMVAASDLRTGFERELSALHDELRSQVSQERERYVRELAGMEGRVDELRRQLAMAARGMRGEIESEQSSRQQIEAALADERLTVARLSDALERLQRDMPGEEPFAGLLGPQAAVAAGETSVPDSAPATRAWGQPAIVVGPDAERRRREMAQALEDAAARLRARADAAADPSGARADEELEPEVADQATPWWAQTPVSDELDVPGPVFPAPAVEAESAPAPAAAEGALEGGTDVEPPPHGAALAADAGAGPEAKMAPTDHSDALHDADHLPVEEPAPGEEAARGEEAAPGEEAESGEVAASDEQVDGATMLTALADTAPPPVAAPPLRANALPGEADRPSPPVQTLVGSLLRRLFASPPASSEVPAATVPAAPVPLAPPDIPASAPEPQPLESAAAPDVAASAPDTPALEPPGAEEPADALESGETPVGVDSVELFFQPLGPTEASTPPWLSRSIATIAAQRDAQLAADLIAELLPAQGLVLDRATTYGLSIAEGANYVVAITPGRAAEVSRVTAASESPELEFTLSGPAAAYANLIAARGSRRLGGLTVSGNRRRARQLARARPWALSLGELARAGIRVWPGLMLLALAEAIDPSWTVGHHFVVAFAIEGTPGATLYVAVADGEPVLVSHLPPGPEPSATLQMSEAAFMSLSGRTPLAPGERIMVSGDREVAQRLLGWTDRAQGRPAS